MRLTGSDSPPIVVSAPRSGSPHLLFAGVAVGILLLFLVFPATLSTAMGWLAGPTQKTAFSLSVGSSGSQDITGPPTVTTAFIDTVLKKAGSPVAGLGALISQLGVQYHVNPAFALAVFHHESSYGLQGVAASTRNFGNIRCTPGWRCDPTGGYRWYPSWEAGIADFYRILQDVYLSEGRTTVSSILQKYAPAGDNNNVDAYINAVETDLATWKQQQGR